MHEVIIVFAFTACAKTGVYVRQQNTTLFDPSFSTPTTFLQLFPSVSRISATPLSPYRRPAKHSLALHKTALSRNDSTILNSGCVSPCEITVNRHVTVKIRQNLSGTGGVPPVPHQITDNREQADKLDTSLLHAGVGRVADELGGSS
jgi:hypothetical protein